MTVVINSIYDEVCAAVNMNAPTDGIYSAGNTSAVTYLSEALVNRLTYAHILGAETTYTVNLRGDNFDFDGETQSVYQVYHAGQRMYEYWLSPSFTVEANVSYKLNASGTVEVTTTAGVGTAEDSRSEFAVSAVPVNFAMLMVSVYRHLANHASRSMQMSMGGVSSSPATVRQELMRQASYWAHEHYLYMVAR